MRYRWGTERAAEVRQFKERVKALHAAPRLSASLTRGETAWPVGEVWGNARLDVGPGPLVNVFTGEHQQGGEVHLASIMRVFPIACSATVSFEKSQRRATLALAAEVKC